MSPLMLASADKVSAAIAAGRCSPSIPHPATPQTWGCVLGGETIKRALTKDNEERYTAEILLGCGLRGSRSKDFLLWHCGNHQLGANDRPTLPLKAMIYISSKGLLEPESGE